MRDKLLRTERKNMRGIFETQILIKIQNATMMMMLVWKIERRFVWDERKEDTADDEKSTMCPT